jgi:hypothetical protein
MKVFALQIQNILAGAIHDFDRHRYQVRVDRKDIAFDRLAAICDFPIRRSLLLLI